MHVTEANGVHRQVKPGDEFEVRDQDSERWEMFKIAERIDKPQQMSHPEAASEPVKRGPGRPRKVDTEGGSYNRSDLRANED
jgi:hypothetical protein